MNKNIWMKTRFRTCKIAKFGNFGLIGLSPLPYIFKHAHRNLSCRIVFKSLVIGSKLNMYRRTWVLFAQGATSMQADDENKIYPPINRNTQLHFRVFSLSLYHSLPVLLYP